MRKKYGFKSTYSPTFCKIKTVADSLTAEESLMKLIYYIRNYFLRKKYSGSKKYIGNNIVNAPHFI